MAFQLECNSPNNSLKLRSGFYINQVEDESPDDESYEVWMVDSFAERSLSLGLELSLGVIHGTILYGMMKRGEVFREKFAGNQSITISG
ncbi:unnamed protein product [Lactuca virosa]|uniref:Uncharacterized protein n=1 Tax=Lactuca virosa TaxID=75947 RepID=A0AAU9N6A9_9ASTR|nr:unnamed protein product [Lactuca virosa]